jgi:hypothetical protein
MSVLNLIVKKQWYDQIATGQKTEEYRDHKPFWDSRLECKDGFYKYLRFQLAYTKTAMYFECNGILMDFDMDCYVILIGKPLQQSEVSNG